MNDAQLGYSQNRAYGNLSPEQLSAMSQAIMLTDPSYAENPNSNAATMVLYDRGADAQTVYQTITEHLGGFLTHDLAASYVSQMDIDDSHGLLNTSGGINIQSGVEQVISLSSLDIMSDSNVVSARKRVQYFEQAIASKTSYGSRDEHHYYASGLQKAKSDYEFAVNAVRDDQIARGYLPEFIASNQDYINIYKNIEGMLELGIGGKFSPIALSKKVLLGIGAAAMMLYSPSTDAAPKIKVGKSSGKNSKFSFAGEFVGKLKGLGLNRHQKGVLGEIAMERHMMREGYSLLPSKVGSNNGFDGVFVKYAKDGTTIQDMVIMESKYSAGGKWRLAKLKGKETIGMKQMSKKWFEHNLKRMKTGEDSVKETARAIQRLQFTDKSRIKFMGSILDKHGNQTFKYSDNMGETWQNYIYK